MKLILGTANFQTKKYGINKLNNPTYQQVNKILNFSKSKIKYLDISENYSLNLNNNLFKKFKLILKIKLNFFEKKISKHMLLKYVEDIIEKNNLINIDTLMFHRTSDIFKLKKSEFSDAIIILKKNFCKRIGISIYDPKELTKVFKYFKPDIVQCPLNLFDNRINESGWMTKMKSKNIEIHIRSVFLQGLLLINLKKIPNKFLKYKKYFTKVDNFSQKIKKNRTEICLNHLKQYEKKIDCLVIGVQSVTQLKEIINLKKNKKFQFLKFKKVPKKLYDPRLW